MPVAALVQTSTVGHVPVACGTSLNAVAGEYECGYCLTRSISCLCGRLGLFRPIREPFLSHNIQLAFLTIRIEDEHLTLFLCVLNWIANHHTTAMLPISDCVGIFGSHSIYAVSKSS